ncbi:MAG: DUF4292 domain-containing protein [Archangium sp.]|nr:DUF4292 domain-containing protein [Archangium sp.]
MLAAIARQRFALLILPVAFLLGCPPRRVDFGKDGAPTSAKDLLARVNFAESQVFSLKGDGRLGVDSPQGKGSVTLFAAVQHPAFIHIEQLDFFGKPQGVFVTDGERFGLYMAQEGKFFRGPATAANLSRFLPIVMPPSELASVMLGRAPRIPIRSADQSAGAVDELEMRFDDSLQLFVLTITRGKVRQILHVQPPSYRVVKSRAENLNAYELDFSDITTIEPSGVTVPKTAALDARLAKTKVELVWKEMAVNEAPDMTLFDLAPPEGIPVVEVDANGDPSQPPAQ